MTFTDPLPAAEAAIGEIRATPGIAMFARGEPGYDEARSGYGLTNLPSPGLVVLPADTDQVRTLVQIAGAHALPIAVHGTGHNFAFPYRGGMLVNTSKLRSVTFDDAAGTVTVGAGARWKDVLPGAQARGRAPLSGSSPEVGVLGYTLHGGVGWLARAYGAAVDTVRSAWVVTADGRLREASATRHPDLFWALRGAGGNFGVVVALELALAPVATVFGGARMYPLERAGEVLKVYRRWVDGVPDAMTSSVTLLRLPPLASLPDILRGRRVVALRACYAGDEADAVSVMEPLGVLGPPMVDTFRTMPYAETGEISADPTEPSAAWRHTAELADLDERAIEALLERAGPGADSPLTGVEVRHLGGALARTADPVGLLARKVLLLQGHGDPEARRALVREAGRRLAQVPERRHLRETGASEPGEERVAELLEAAALDALEALLAQKESAA